MAYDHLQHMLIIMQYLSIYLKKIIVSTYLQMIAFSKTQTSPYLLSPALIHRTHKVWNFEKIKFL